MTITILQLIGYLLLFIAIDLKRPSEHKISKNVKDWWVYLVIIFASYISSNPNLIISIFGYITIIAIVDYHRPKEFMLKIFTKDWWIMILLLSFGTSFIN